LVIEDDPYTNELISNLLSTRGFNILSVTTGEEAIETLKTHVPDLVILDLLLPRLDGWEICKILHKPGSKTERIPILVLSVLSRFDSVVFGPEMSGVSFFSKPFEAAGLIAEVERIFEKSPQ